MQDEIMAAMEREVLAAGPWNASLGLFRHCHACIVLQLGSDIAVLRANHISLRSALPRAAPVIGMCCHSKLHAQYLLSGICA